MAFYNESKFNMWRACIGVIWIDGEISAEEEAWIKEKIQNLKFTEEQRAILKSDLKSNINFEEVFKNITARSDRAFLVHQMRTIAHLDKSFSTSEKQLFEKWQKFVLDQVDLTAMEEMIKKLNMKTPNNKKQAFEQTLASSESLDRDNLS